MNGELDFCVWRCMTRPTERRADSLVFSAKRKMSLRNFVRDMMHSQIVHESIFSEKKNVCPSSWQSLPERYEPFWNNTCEYYSRKPQHWLAKKKHSQQWPLIADTTTFVHVSHRCSSICAALGWQHRRQYVKMKTRQQHDGAHFREDSEVEIWHQCEHRGIVADGGQKGKWRTKKAMIKTRLTCIDEAQSYWCETKYSWWGWLAKWLKRISVRINDEWPTSGRNYLITIQ